MKKRCLTIGALRGMLLGFSDESLVALARSDGLAIFNDRGFVGWIPFTLEIEVTDGTDKEPGAKEDL